ncbi:UNVERIFIED_CONTAM: O-acyltransferase WSD1 [Sesamum latifolium]|uniref:diacylglycerol O-acyltransferase n=1 Tax=Sesamum latifolium TaxID=2727402 RepID=A0AAW2WSA9_9LAMI
MHVMELEQQEEVLEPMSPSAQYLKSSVLSLTILGVLESEVPIDDSMTMPLLKDVFLPINPRFSSIMVTGKKGVKKWKKVEVNLQDHVHIPTFPTGMSTDYYDECFTDYLTKLAMEQLPPNRPLWEIHVLKYPTKNAAGNLIFKLHHSLGDGYSLMGALLSCLQRVDNPLMPLTFPSRQSNGGRNYALLGRVPRFLTGLLHTACDFGWSLLRAV